MKKPKTSVVSFTAYDTETKKILLNVKRGLHSLRMMIKQCECKGRYYSRKFQILKATQRRSDTATFGILNIIGDVLGAIKLYILLYIKIYNNIYNYVCFFQHIVNCK